MPLKSTRWVYPKNAIEMVHLDYVNGDKIEKDELADGALGVIHKW